MKIPSSSRAIVVLLSIMVLAQIIGIPRNAGPDESAHLIRSAGLVRGEVFGAEGAEPSTRVFDVPGWVGLPGAACYAFQEEQSVSCVRDDDRSGPLSSSAATYQVWPHVLPGIGSLLPGSEGTVWFSRVLGALLPVGLIAAALRRLLSRKHQLAPAVALLALTPATLSTIAVVNPSGMAITGAMAMTVGLLGCLSPGTQTADRLLGTAGFASLVLARTDGLVWALVIVACVATMGGAGSFRRLSSGIGRRAGAVAAGCGLLAAGWSLLVPPELIRQPRSATGIVLVTRIIGRTGQHLLDAVGTAGWLDARIPDTMIMLWLMALGAILAAALNSAKAAEIRSIAAMGVLIIVLPWALEYLRAAEAGLFWQGRYSLPLIVSWLVIVGHVADRSAGAARLAPLIGVATWLVWNLGFAQQLRRWSVGSSGSLAPWNLNTGLGVAPTIGCLAAFAVSSALLVLGVCRAASNESVADA